MKIRTRLFLVFISLTIVLLLTVLLTYHNTSIALSQQISSHLDSVATLQHARINGIIAQNYERLKLVSSRTQLRLSLTDYQRTGNPAHLEKIRRILQDALQSIPDFRRIDILSPEGKILISTDKGIDTGRESPCTHQDCYQKGLTTESLACVHLHDTNAQFHVSGPLTLNGKLLGVVLIDCNMDDILNAVQDYTGLGRTGETLLVGRDTNREPVFLAPTRFFTQAMLQKVPNPEKYAVPSQKVFQEANVFYKKTLDYRGVKVIARTHYIPQTDWGLVVKIDRREAFAPLIQLSLFLGIFILVYSGFIIAAVMMLSRTISRPIQALTLAAEQIALGNTTQPLPDDRLDELGILSQAFNTMVNRLTEANSQLIQAQKMEALGTLAGGIAHDFNNLLTPILGYSDLALDTLPPHSPTHADILEIRNAAQRAKDLIGQILTFSRRSGQQKIPLSVQSIAKEVLKLLRSSIPVTIEISHSIDPNCRPVLADPIQLHQIIMNLCTNAYQAMKNQGGTLTLSLNEVKDPLLTLSGEYLCLVVEDNGPGIPAEILPHIFDPFFTTKHSGGGSGLGLSVVHGIIHSLGGEIQVDSQPGKGARFQVYLPVTDQQPFESIHTQSNTLPGGREKLLVVDDMPELVLLYTRILESLGYQVSSCTNSTEAWSLLQSDPGSFDLLITDMTMPDMTGDKLAEKAWALRPELPVIIITGYSEKLSEQTAEQAGFSAYLKKPIIKADLAQTVRRVLDERHSESGRED